MQQTWLNLSLADRSYSYFRIRIAVNLSIALITVLAAFLFGYFSLIWVAILALDTFVLMFCKKLAAGGSIKLSLWTSLLTTLLLGSCAIFLGGGSILLALIIYIILTLSTSLVFLSSKMTWVMATVSGVAFGVRIFLEAFLVIRPAHPGFVSLLQVNPLVAYVNVAGGYFLLMLFAVFVGRAAEQIGQWHAQVEVEVKKKTRELRESLLRERQASLFLRLLSEVNQLIAREHDPMVLFDEVCEMFVRENYSYAWIGRIAEGSGEIEILAKSGDPINLLSCDIRNSLCIQKAVQIDSHVVITLEDSSELCKKCSLNPILQSRAAVALPLRFDFRLRGVLVVARIHEDFSDFEIASLQNLADNLAYALENLEIENQRKAIANTARNLLTAQDEKSFWPVTLDSVRFVLRADRAAVYLLDRKADRLECPYADGLSQEYIQTINSRFRETPGSRVFQNSKPVIINDIETDPLGASMRVLFQKEGFRSFAVFPLFSSDKLMGAFVAYRDVVSPFTNPDIETGQTLAHLIAAALQNVRLFSTTRSKAVEQATLYSAAQDLSASIFDPSALFDTLARHLELALDVTSIYTLSLDVAEEKIVVLAEYWSDKASVKERKPDLGRVYSSQDFPSIYHAIKSGEVLSMQTDDPILTPLEMDEYLEYGIQSALFVPLLSHGSIVGFLEIWESRKKRVFSQSEINLARAMASYAANIIQISNLYTELKNSYDATLEGWARALELRDKNTEGHTRRVTELAVELARSMNLAEEQIVHLQRGAILHDIGKIALSDSILQKPGALTMEEKTMMRQHPTLAYEMLFPINHLRPALDIPYCHHERWNGKGYPRGLQGEQIPIAARIFSVVDVYDALTSDRPYRKAWDKSRAIEYIAKRSGIEFDPQVVDIFLRIVKNDG